MPILCNAKLECCCLKAKQSTQCCHFQAQCFSTRELLLYYSHRQKQTASKHLLECSSSLNSSCYKEIYPLQMVKFNSENRPGLTRSSSSCPLTEPLPNLLMDRAELCPVSPRPFKPF